VTRRRFFLRRSPHQIGGDLQNKIGLSLFSALTTFLFETIASPKSHIRRPREVTFINLRFRIKIFCRRFFLRRCVIQDHSLAVRESTMHSGVP